MIIAVTVGMHPKQDKTTTNWPFKPNRQLLLLRYWFTVYLARTKKLCCISIVTAAGLNNSLAADAESALNIPTAQATIHADEIQRLTLDFAQQYFTDSYQNSADNSRIEISPARLDPRLKLARCTNAVEFDPQNSNPRAGRVLIKLRCTGQNPWAIYVPVNVQIWKKVVTASRPLRRGESIGKNDIELREVKLNRTSAHYLTQLEHAIGQLITRDTAKAAPLTTNYLTTPKLVKRGDDVLIVSTSGSVSVKMMGTALADGKQHEQIAVRNQRSNRVIKARVVDRGRVQVGS